MQETFFAIENGLLNVGAYYIQLRLLFLLVLVGIAVVFDWRQRRIPNWLVFPGLAAGLLYQWVSPFDLGILSALKGAGIGFAMLLPLYVLRAMGAGDVKLMAMVGAFVGGAGDAFATVIYTLVCGGILSLGYAAIKGLLPSLIGNMKLMLFGTALNLSGGKLAIEQTATLGKVPYAFAIAGGVLTHLYFSY